MKISKFCAAITLASAVVFLTAQGLLAGLAVPDTTITVDQNSSGVVFTLSGFVNENDFGSSTPSNNSVTQEEVTPSKAIIGFDNAENFNIFTLNNFAGPANFGSGGTTALAAPAAAPANLPGSPYFLFDAADNEIFLSTSYTSGNPINNSMTFAGATYASLGINSTPGTYNYSWSNPILLGPSLDGVNPVGTLAIVVDAPTSTVPDTGSTLFLMGLGLAGIEMARRKVCVIRA